MISHQSQESPISEMKIWQFEYLSMVPKLEVVHTRHGNLQLGKFFLCKRIRRRKNSTPLAVEFRCVSTRPALQPTYPLKKTGLSKRTWILSQAPFFRQIVIPFQWWTVGVVAARVIVSALGFLVSASTRIPFRNPDFCVFVVLSFFHLDPRRLFLGPGLRVQQ